LERLKKEGIVSYDTVSAFVWRNSQMGGNIYAKIAKLRAEIPKWKIPRYEKGQLNFTYLN
jgi:hypothetical protein